jgi:biopolymer transport protein TolR
MNYEKRRYHSDDRPMAEINVTPLVDVMLVLLIIFMVTAPMLQMGIDVNLPRVKAKSVDVAEEKLVLTINGAKQIYINKTMTPLAELGKKLELCIKDRARGLYAGGPECPIRVCRRSDG